MGGRGALGFFPIPKYTGRFYGYTIWLLPIGYSQYDSLIDSQYDSLIDSQYDSLIDSQYDSLLANYYSTNLNKE